MVDYNELRKKFPAKGKGRKSNSAAIKRIAREYEMKKAELGALKAPALKKGIVFYAVVIIGLLMLGSLVLSATGKGGRPRVSRANIDARKSVEALAIALGRFRYHTGAYPADLEDLASTRIIKAGWNGPYVKKIVPDPWGSAYVWDPAAPALYSKGPDGVGGTSDDIIAAQELFNQPFVDTSWTRTWVPYRLRGIVVAPDEETKRVVSNQVSNYLSATALAAEEVAAAHDAFLAKGVGDDEIASARRAILAVDSKPVHILTHWTWNEETTGEVDVVARVQGDGAELFVNNESQGRGKREEGRVKSEEVAEFAWRVPYEPGEIKVIGWRNASPIGEDAVVTAFAPEAVKLRILKERLGDDETGFALAEVVDERGVAVPLETPAFEFAIEGPGEIVRVAGDMVAFRRNKSSGEELVLAAASGKLRPARAAIPWQPR